MLAFGSSDVAVIKAKPIKGRGAIEITVWICVVFGVDCCSVSAEGLAVTERCSRN